MKSISSPYKELLADLLEGLKKAFGDDLVSLVVYGSVARGDYRKDSDIDLLIVCRELPKEKLRRQELFIKVEDGLNLDALYNTGFYPNFSPVLKTVPEAKFLTPLYLDMVEDAVILYDKKDFFRNILGKLKTGLEEHGAKRISIGKKWYWDLKPGLKCGEVVVIE